MSPTEVAAAVKAQFNIELTRQQVQFYDPTKRAGCARLSPSLCDLFAVTRHHFISSADDIGIAHLRYRLECLQRILDKAQERWDARLMLKVLEQAAKEMGGWYVRRRDVQRPQKQAMERLLAQEPGPINLQDWIQEHTWKKQAS
jgi:hypothetical protein